jgi:hypothetical protein
MHFEPIALPSIFAACEKEEDYASHEKDVREIFKIFLI